MKQIIKLEEFAIEVQLVSKEEASISPIINSLEMEWVKRRQDSYFAQLRSFLIQQRDHFGIVEYDCHSPIEEKYSFRFDSYGNQDDVTGYYQLFAVESPPFTSSSSNSSFQNHLSMDVCKVRILNTSKFVDLFELSVHLPHFTRLYL